MQVICAWCDRPLQSGPDDGRVSHGLCIGCYPAVSGNPIVAMTEISIAEAEALPYGVVRLDRDGRVVAYNGAEATLAHRDRHDVLGQLFFEDIAPCTNVRELAGWVDGARNRGVSDTTRIEFVFEFAFGRELVEIALSYDDVTDGSQLIVRSRASARDDPSLAP